MNAAEAAAAYLKKGWSPVPIPPRSKNPGRAGWQKYQATAEGILRDFQPGDNVGLLLGESSEWLVDVDLDCDETRFLAPIFLPETGSISGRPGSRCSHYWYTSIGCETTRFNDDAGVLVELRSTGAQTLAPPSVHPGGEVLAWEEEGTPALVEVGELKRSVSRLAACALMARNWPAQGLRQEASLALSGVLLKARWPEEDATQFVYRAAEAAGDEEWRKRGAAVRSTVENLQGGRRVTGIPKLRALLGANASATLNKLIEWLDLPKSGAAVDIQTWPPRQVLPSLETAVPLLREELLPGALRPWAADAAERLQVPLEYVAVPTIVSAASVIGRSVGIRPKQFDDWLVVVNLWAAIVGRPGFLKSPSLAVGTSPLRRLDALAAEAFDEEETGRDARRASVKARREAVKTRMRTDAKKSDLLREHEAEYAALGKEQNEISGSAKRYTTNDSTVEKLAMLLADNPRGLLMMRDELVGWMKTLDKQGHERDRAFYLEGWNGYGSYRIDRVERGSLRVEALCISVLGGIQPGKLLPYVLDATEGGTGDDGLLQRLQLIVWPEHSNDWKEIDRWPNSEARSRVNRIFDRLDRLAADELGAVEDEHGEIPAVRFDEDAQEIFSEWYGNLERRIRSGTIQSEALESHLSKYRSLVPSLALVFYAVDVADGLAAGAGVPIEAAWKAIEWAKYLEAHAGKVYAASLRRDLHAAHALWRKLEGGEIRDGQTVRSIYRRGWSQLRKREDVEAGLELLEDLHWLVLESQKTDGRSAEVVRLHPDLIRQDAA